MYWSKMPAFRILIWLALGILARHFMSIYYQINPVILWAAVTISLAVYIHTIFFQHRHVNEWLTAFSFSIMFFFIGMLITSYSLSTKKSQLPLDSVYMARLVSDPKIGKNVIITEFDAWPADSTQYENKQHFRVLGYFEKSAASEQLRYGNLIVFDGLPQLVQAPSNPGEFDYKAYLSMKGIFHSVYLRNNNWKLLGHDPPSHLLAWAFNTRWQLLSVLKLSGLDEEEFAVAAAILLGNDDFMDENLRQNYVYAGAMHILCVSGLHVGIIFIIFNFLLSFLNKKQAHRYLKAIILILLIWTYAAITGLSPSVQRAGIMVSIFIFSQLTPRHKNNLNILAVSAIIILIFNPLLLFHVGFQLSYAAVAGILILYQPIYQQIYLKNMVLDKIWSITALSIAAQISTFPLAVHYFHFFPTWFWLTNLFTYPLSFAILTGGMAFIVLSWVPGLSYLLGWLLAGLVYMLNYVTELVRYLPFPGLTKLYLPSIEVLAIYLLTLLLFEFIFQKRWRLLLPIMLATLFIVTTETIQHRNHLQQRGVIVFNISKHSVVQLIDGRNNLVVTDSTLANNLSSVDFFLQACQSRWGLYPTTPLTPSATEIIECKGYYKDGPFIMAGNERIFLMDEQDQFFPTANPLPIDILIVSGHAGMPSDSLLKVFKTKLVISTASLPTYLKKQLAKAALEKGVPYYNTSVEGAFLLGIE